MSKDLQGGMRGIYVLLIVLDIAIATIIWIGVGFSSPVLANEILICMVIPLVVGFFAFFRTGPLFTSFTFLGCFSTIVYIYWFNQKNLRDILPFHIFWSLLTLALGASTISVIKRRIRTQE